MPIKLTCPICNKKHKRSPSEKHHICCSNKCGQEFKFLNILNRYSKSYYSKLYLKDKMSFRQIEKKTNICAKTLRTIFKIYNIPIRHGSEAVKTQWINNDKRKKEISKLFQKTRPKIPWNKHQTKENNKTIKKISEMRKGKGNPAWKNGITSELGKLRSSSNHRQWAKLVKTRDNHTCQKCGSKEKLVAHHIKSFINNPKLRADIDNGITLCHSCHWKIHSTRRSL